MGDTSSEVRTITDLHKSPNTKAHKPTKDSKDSKDSKVAHTDTNSTSFHAKKTDDFWRLKPNNGSPYMCDVSLYDWFGKLANDSRSHMRLTPRSSSTANRTTRFRGACTC